MANVFDVAAYILEHQGRMTTMKLQKLCYYSQAWRLVWADKPLFAEDIQAWANGPVCPQLYKAYKGRFDIDATQFDRGDASRLSEDERESIDAVLETYGSMSARQLSDLSHHEAPWADARGDLPEGERSTSIISTAAMAEYYGSFTD